MTRIYKILVSTVIVSCAAIGSAQAALVVSTKATHNVSCSAGVCTATASSAVMNVSDLTSMLASSDVTLVSGSHAQDIEVKAPFSWASTSRLTLDAFHSIAVEKLVTVSGTGALTLTTNDGGTGGTLSFTAPGRVAFWDLSSSLIVNGASYTLVGDIATLASDVASNPAGDYALANNYDATPDGTYAHSPVPTALSGAVEGLGNTITKLTIKDTAMGEDVGLFASIAPSGSVDDLLLTTLSATGGKQKDIGGIAGVNAGTLQGDVVKGSIRALGANGYAGLLAGINLGNIRNCQSSGTVKQTNGFKYALGGMVGLNESLIDQSSSSASPSSPALESPLGGLVGQSSGGTITNSFATGAVTSTGSSAGGLLGAACCDAASSISNSYATGAVAGAVAGGLAGELAHAGDSIVNSHASGNITGSEEAGGLVGSQALGTTVSGSHATGNISGIDNNGTQFFGGLVGVGAGAIVTSYATGNVVLNGTQGGNGGGLVGSNGGGIDRSFATGSVTGETTTSSQYEGGLIGLSNQTSQGIQAIVVNSYATGAVDGVSNGSSVGGFAGGSSSHTFISDSYEIGAVSNGSKRGGFIGDNRTDSGHNTDDYWDTITSGASQGVGHGVGDGVTGLTSTELQSGLPSGFDPSIWAQSPSINGGFPYLIANPPP